LNCYWFLFVTAKRRRLKAKTIELITHIGGQLDYYKSLCEKANELNNAMKIEFANYVSKSQAREIEQHKRYEHLKNEFNAFKLKNKKQ
jgi:hypothetical protein